MLLIWLAFFLVVSHADADYRKQQFQRTWTAPIVPKSQLKSPDDNTSEFIEHHWNVSNQIQGSRDVKFVNDPSLSSQSVLRVFYPKGSFSPAGSRSSGSVEGGVLFHSRPFGKNQYNKALLSYDVYFPPDFDWVLGGKLPGIEGGVVDESCSGGHQSDGVECFSARVMWREHGNGEAYMYVPVTNQLCAQDNVICNQDGYGTSMGRGELRFRQGQWTSLDMYLEMNTPGKADGLLILWQDDVQVIKFTEMEYRETNGLGAGTLMFTTFFGGSTKEWAAPKDEQIYFKNVKMSVSDHTEQTDNGQLSFYASRLLYLVSCLLLFFVHA
ncbi:hypothetical protein BC940DRAFT_357782 [Gongronella butleri]|nr:hypothetical protein BC940DRAFT_357782 [Gongronella butleri]